MLKLQNQLICLLKQHVQQPQQEQRLQQQQQQQQGELYNLLIIENDEMQKFNCNIIV